MAVNPNAPVAPTAAAKISCGERYNNMIGKLAGRTFGLVNGLQFKEGNGALAKTCKVFASFLMTATIVPLVALFAAAGVAKVLSCLCGAVRKPPAAAATAALDAATAAAAATATATAALDAATAATAAGAPPAAAA
jgi:hypothetical protein